MDNSLHSDAECNFNYLRVHEMQLELFRISMILRDQIDFDEYKHSDGRIPSRAECLNFIFSKKMKFKVKNEFYHFTPPEVKFLDNGITGKIGRETIEQENAPPEENFRDIQRPQWHASNVFIDPTHHDDGQQLAFEIKSGVGNSQLITQSLAAYINSLIPKIPYIIEIEAMIDETSFWEFAKRNKGNITYLSLEAPVPNMFGHQGDFDQDMRDYRDKERASKVGLVLKSPDGLDVDTEMVRQGAEYVSKAGGQISARAKHGKNYNSKNKRKKIDTADNSNNEKNILFAIILAALKGLEQT